MEFDASYYLRKSMISSLNPPTIGDAKRQLGKELTEVFINSCPDSLLKQMNLEKKLEGPGNELWISPSDMLINKVVLKPPLTYKHTKALTHQGILEIGERIEEKFLRKIQEKTEKELQECEEVMLFFAERDKQKAVDQAVENEHEKFSSMMSKMNENFEELLQKELLKLQEYLCEIYECTMLDRINELLEIQEQEYLEKMESVVRGAVNDLTKKFLDDMVKQEEEITKIFNNKLAGIQEKNRAQRLIEHEAFLLILKQLKHNLQCNNIANLMFVLCSERNKCLVEKQEIIDFYEDAMSKLQITVHNNTEEIDYLTKKKLKAETKIKLREEFLCGILKQFQKFINFAFNAAPTQAEFLLNVGKMMTFELAQVVAQIDKSSSHPCRRLMPWRTPSMESSENEIIKDYHDCLNEFPIPNKDEEGDDIVSVKSLVSVTYNNRTYLREDFRNKYGDALNVPANSKMWNNDVDNLVHIMRVSTQEEARSPTSSVHFSYDYIKDNLSNDQTTKVAITEKESLNHQLGILATQDSVLLLRSIKSPSESNQNAQQTTPVALLGVEDSLTTIKNMEAKKSMDKPMDKHLSNMTIKLSKNKVRASQVSKQLSTITLQKRDSHKKPDEEIVDIELLPAVVSVPKIRRSGSISKGGGKSKDLSKLCLHRDSLELIKPIEHSKIQDLIKIKPQDGVEKAHLVLNIPDNEDQFISFQRVASLYTGLKQPDQPWKIYERKDSEIEVNEKPVEIEKFTAAKIIGAPEDVCKKDFTINRIHSLVNILKNDDSLIRMFTGCTQ